MVNNKRSKKDIFGILVIVSFLLMIVGGVVGSHALIVGNPLLLLLSFVVPGSFYLILWEMYDSREV